MLVVGKDVNLLTWQDYGGYISHLLRQANHMCSKNNSFAF